MLKALSSSYVTSSQYVLNLPAAMRPESTMIDLGSPLIPRSYELEIVAVAKYRNTLAFLPTLHGKNLISLLLIKHRLDRVKIIDSFLEISIAILVPTR